MTDYSPHSAPEAFARRAREHPDKPALFYLGTAFSYGRMWSWARRIAAGLARRGVEPGDRVMIYLENTPQWVAAYLGVQLCGAAAAPLSPIYPARDLKLVARDCGAKAVFCSNANFGYVAEILPDTDVQMVIHTRLTEPLPLWKRFLAAALDRAPRGRTYNAPNVISFGRLLASSSSGWDGRGPGLRDLAAILYTGGTTQAPKGAPYTHDLLLDPVSAQLETFQGVIPPGRNTIMLAAPLFHITGITFGIGAMCLYGDSVILIPRLNLDALMAAVDRRRATSLFGGPTLYRLLLEHDRLGHYSLRSLKYCFSGGDVFPGQVGRRWLDRYGLRIVQGYGATETGGGVILCPPDRSFPDQSVGWPVPGKRLKLVDPDTLDDVPDGRPGELLVGSDPMIEAYWNRPEESDRAFISVDGRLWYRTGDMLRRDDDGYYYFVDRVDDAVWTRNGRVSVSEIETRLQEHPAVTAACVVGAPGADGDRLKAFVVLKENQRGLAGRDLTLWLGQRLPPHKIPEYIEFRDSLPRSKVGKLLRREIRSEQQGRLIKGRYDAAAED